MMRLPFLIALFCPLWPRRLPLWPNSPKRLPNPRLPFIRPNFFPVRRNPAVPPEEIVRGVETGIKNVIRPGIGKLASGIVNAALRKILEIIGKYAGMASTPSRECVYRIMLYAFSWNAYTFLPGNGIHPAL